MNKISKLDLMSFPDKEFSRIGTIKISSTRFNIEILIDKLNEVIDHINYSDNNKE